jgi:hypothetical protein
VNWEGQSGPLRSVVHASAQAMTNIASPADPALAHRNHTIVPREGRCLLQAVCQPGCWLHCNDLCGLAHPVMLAQGRYNAILFTSFPILENAHTGGEKNHLVSRLT